MIFLAKKGNFDWEAVEVGEGVEERNEGLGHEEIGSISRNYQRDANLLQACNIFETKKLEEIFRIDFKKQDILGQKFGYLF